MKRNKKYNIYTLCLSVVIISLFMMQITTAFLGKKTMEEVITKNQGVITTLYANKMPRTTLVNDYFTFALPKGMQLYAQQDNNMKLRSGNIFYTVHVFTSSIDVDTYANEAFLDGKRHELPDFRNQDSFVYTRELSPTTLEVAVFNDNVEVLFITPKTKIENTLLKAIELLRNVEVSERMETPIFIGAKDRKNPQTILDSTEGANTTDENLEVEIPIRSEKTETNNESESQ